MEVPQGASRTALGRPDGGYGAEFRQHPNPAPDHRLHRGRGGTLRSGDCLLDWGCFLAIALDNMVVDHFLINFGENH